MAVDEAAPDLTGSERDEARAHKSVKAHIVHEAVRQDGEEEMARPASALAWSGLAAGLSMGASLMAEGLFRSHLPDALWRPLIAKLGYPLGFLLVIVGRQQLFTENTLTPIIPLMSNCTRGTFVKVVRLWAVVLFSNQAGASVAAWVLSNTGLFYPEVRSAFLAIGRDALDVDPGHAILRGIFAGWLIAMAVWMIEASPDSRLSIIVILTYIVGLAGLTHIIAGSIEVLFVVFSGQASIISTVGRYILPTLLGNSIGGVSLVAALNHAQVVSGRKQC